MAKNQNKKPETLGQKMGLEYGNTGAGCEEKNREVYKIGISDADRRRIERQTGAKVPPPKEYNYPNNKGQAQKLARQQAQRESVTITTVRYTNGRQTEEHTYYNLGSDPGQMRKARNNLNRMDRQNKNLAKKGQTKRYRNKTEMLAGQHDETIEAKAQFVDRISYIMVCVEGKPIQVNLNYKSPAMQKRAAAHKKKTGSKRGAKQSCGPPARPRYCYCALQKNYGAIYRILDDYITKKDIIPTEGLVFDTPDDVKKAVKKNQYTKLKLVEAENKKQGDFFLILVNDCSENPLKK